MSSLLLEGITPLLISQSGFRQAGFTATDFARRILALYILIDPATLGLFLRFWPCLETAVGPS